jgi:hypothetical protein
VVCCVAVWAADRVPCRRPTPIRAEVLHLPPAARTHWRHPHRRHDAGAADKQTHQTNRYENTERRKAKVEALGLRYMGMGVSGGEEGARRGVHGCGHVRVCVWTCAGMPALHVCAWR